ncbi:MAG: hypothetical protein ACRDH5_07895, partial [bacterium]
MRHYAGARGWFVLALLLAAPSAATAREPAAPPVTLEGLLSAPFASELLASPSGGRLAWVQVARGARNVWVAEPPEYRGRALTRDAAADGQALGGLEWTPDGGSLVYVRGSGANRQGEYPNPAGAGIPSEQSVWRVGLDGGE